jgi:hypothetical protein
VGEETPVTDVIAAPPAPTIKVPKSFGLNKLVQGWMALRPGTPRSPGFHPSEMGESKFCAALHYFAEQERENLSSPSPEKVAAAQAFWKTLVNQRRAEPDLQMEFDAGDAIHAAVKFNLGAQGILWGVWRCEYCRSRTEPGFMPRTQIPDIHGRPMLDAAPCQVCDGRNLLAKIPWEYIETGIDRARFAKEWGFVGHMDGDLRIPFRPTPEADPVIIRAALEIKSIHEYGWGESKKEYWVDKALANGWTPPARGWTPELPRKPLPKEEHITQDSLYAWCLEIPYLCFIYVNKNACHEWKEFVVPLDMKPIHEATGRILQVRRARAEGRPPLHARACPDIREERARKCPAVERCFGAKPHVNFMDPKAKG